MECAMGGREASSGTKRDRSGFIDRKNYEAGIEYEVKARWI